MAAGVTAPLIVIFLLALKASSSAGAPIFFPLFIVAMMVLVGFGYRSQLRDRERYAKAKRAHNERRDRVLDELDQRGALKGGE